MANSRMVNIGISVDSQRAVKGLEKLRVKVDDLTENLQDLNTKIKATEKIIKDDPTDKVAQSLLKKLKKDFDATQKVLQKVAQDYQNMAQRVGGIDSMLENISTANYNDLTWLRTTLTNSLKNRRLETAEELKNYRETAKRLQKVRDEILKRDIDMRGGMTTDRAKEVMKNLDTSSYTDIKNAITTVQQLQRQVEPGSTAWKNYGKQIADASLELKKWDDQAKRTQMLQATKGDLGKMSEQDLQQQLRYWDGIVNGVGRTNVAVTQYKKVLDSLRAEQDKRAGRVMTDIEGGNLGGSIAQMQQRLKMLQEYRTTIDSTNPDAYLRVDAAIEKLNKGIKESQAGFMSFNDAMAKAANLDTFDGTLEDLEKIQKVIKEGMSQELNLSDPADIDRLKQATTLLDNIAKKQQEMARINTKDKGESIMSQVESGTWDGTVGETQEAIKALQEYRTLLKTTDAAGLQRVDEVLEKLKNNTKQAEQGFMSYTQALQHAEEVADGTFNGTIEDLQQIQKVLLEQKQKKLTIGDKKGLDEVNKALYTVETQLRNVGGTGRNLKDILNDIGNANFNELQLAAKQLEEELKNSNEQMDDYATKSANLREVQARMKKLKDDWEDHGNVVEKTAKRLMAYVAVYGGFNAIIGKMKEIINLNLQLSDSMADVQKTTGLAGIELQELGREIERIDSRTSTDKLYEIAAAAGQIGLKTQEDVLGFTKAANTITVALNELGTEGSANLMKIATLTGDVNRFGTEDALLKIGSAVNELTANSAATAGPITDFINRVGGIAGSAKIAVHEMAALGAATDASAQSIEIAGTSMNKLITALMSNTENVAYAANISYRELKGLIDQGDTMQAVIRVFEAMQTMDRGGQSAVLKELGSEGARMNQYVATMIANLDMLKNQLVISRNAFEDNVSVLNEYNVKQESAMGILNRMKNAFTDMFVNSKMTVVLKDILEGIAAIPGWLEKNRLALLAVRVVIAEIAIMNIPKLLNTLLIQLSAMYRLLSGPAIASVGSFAKAWKLAKYEVFKAARQTGASVATATASVKGFTGAMRILGQVIKAHPIMFLASVLTAVGVAWWTLTEETDKAAKATAELSEKHTRQLEEFEALRAAIESVNTSYATRAEAMKEINSLYSKYLGFELSELDTYEKKKAALDYINARLKENQTLELANRQKEAYTEGFSEDTKKASEKLSETLMDIPEIGAKRLTEAMGVIQRAIKDGATSYEEVFSKLETHFNADLTNLISEHQMQEGNLLDWIETSGIEALEKYIENYAELQEQLAGTDEYFAEQKIENERDSNKKRLELAEQQRIQLEAMEQEQAEHMEAIQKGTAVKNESQQIASLKSILKHKEEYLKTTEAILQREKDVDEQYLRTNLDDDKRFDLGNLTAKYGAYTRHQANLMNDMRDEITQMEQQRADAHKQLFEEEARLQEELTKKNNEVQIAESRKTIEELKKQKDDLTVAISKADSKWQSEYVKLQTIAVSETRKQWVENTSNLKSEIETLQIQIAGDPYAKGQNVKDWKSFGEVIDNIDTANVNSLAAAFKRLSEQSQLMTADAKKFVEEFGLELKIEDPEELENKIFEWAMMLRKKLKEHNRGTTGEYLFGTPKEELDGVLSKMETYFVEKQKQIREQYLKGSITNAEMNRRIQANDKEYVNARIELRKYLLDQNSNFIKEMYPGLEDFDLKRLRTQLSLLGDNITTEIENALAKDEDLAREGAIKIREAMQKELLKTNPFKSIINDFRESMDELQLLSSDYEREMVENFKKGFSDLKKLGIEGDLFDPDKLMGLDEDAQRERMDLLKEMAEKSYMIDAQGLREMLESHEEYYTWVHNLDDEQMNVMLTKLQWFYDESLLKQKQYADQLIKEQESAYLQLQEKLEDPAKIQWQIENLKRNRNNLQMANDARDAGAFWAVTMSDETYEENINKITSYNMAIKKLEEDLVDANKKSADKADRTRREQERKAKEEMEASIEALKAYYNEEEAVIRQRAIDRNQSEATLNRELMKNEQKRERDLQELRKKLVGDESSFDPYANGGYKGAITGTIFFGDNKNNKTLARQAEQIRIWGKALRDGMRNEIAKSEVTIQKAIQEQRDKIEKILLEDNPTEKVLHEYLESMDELQLLFGINEEISENERFAGEARLAYLREFANKSYDITAEQLKNEMELHDAFGEWIKGRTIDDYEALLSQLRKFHDDTEEADKKAAERRKKIFDNSSLGRALDEQEKREVGDKEKDVKMWERFQGFDLVTDDAVDKAQIEMYQAKIEASQRYIEQIKLEMEAEIARARINLQMEEAVLHTLENMGASTDEQMGRVKRAEQELASLTNQLGIIIAAENENILENQQAMADRYNALQQRKVEEFKKYSDTVVEWSSKMIEADKDDVESRKESTKEMLKTMITYLRDWAAMKLTEMAMQAMFSTQATTMKGQETVADIGMKIAETQASVIGNSTKATADAVGKFGLKGLLVGAAISAALTALMNVALKAMFKQKSEVESISGAGGGKLATGMLTYAEGNYPVLGNDGQVYNAKYEGAGMKTGIYRGGAHFGIFSEKKPEAIIDGDTTQRLIMNHPDIWKAIVTLSKSGRLPNGYGMRTFATGNIDELTRQAQNTEATVVADNQAQMAQMQATIERNNQVMAQLAAILSHGISANINMYGTGGMQQQMRKADKFAKRTKL